jgi:hypothetical protein
MVVVGCGVRLEGTGGWLLHPPLQRPGVVPLCQLAACLLWGCLPTPTHCLLMPAPTPLAPPISSYNALQTHDLYVALSSVAQRFPAAPLFAVGYSLGSVGALHQAVVGPQCGFCCWLPAAHGQAQGSGFNTHDAYHSRAAHCDTSREPPPSSNPRSFSQSTLQRQTRAFMAPRPRSTQQIPRPCLPGPLVPLQPWLLPARGTAQSRPRQQQGATAGRGCQAAVWWQRRWFLRLYASTLQTPSLRALAQTCCTTLRWRTSENGGMGALGEWGGIAQSGGSGCE